MKKIENQPIDFVVTWVDGSDREWQQEKAKYLNAESQKTSKWASSDIRFRDWDILKYWFRAIEEYAPWVNKVYFVTCGQKPEWLNEKAKKLVLVNHSDFIPKEYLPTFNSNAIELNLFRIKGLSKNFVYFNDDMFLNSPVKPSDFFKNNKPVLLAGFDLARTDYGVTNSDINNAKIYNKHFIKKEVLKKNWAKFLNPKNGKYLIKTLCLLPWPAITGIAENHNPSAYRKSTFGAVWNAEPEILDKTSRNKFRKAEDVNHWLVKGWHVLSGDFEPQSSKISKSYAKPIDNEILADIKNSEHTFICINDIECSELEFMSYKNNLTTALEAKYSKKSSFEK